MQVQELIGAPLLVWEKELFRRKYYAFIKLDKARVN